MFEEFYKEAMQEARDKPQQFIQANAIINSMYINPMIIDQMIDNVDNMNIDELRDFIQFAYSKIVVSLYDPSVDNSYKFAAALLKQRFLRVFMQVTESMLFTEDNRCRINRTVFQYYVYLLKKERANQRITENDLLIKTMMNELIEIMNKDKLPRILGLGYPKDIAILFICYRYSSSQDSDCIRRINYLLIHQDKNLVTEEMIEELYKILYHPYIEFPNLFKYFMCDAQTKDILNQDMMEIDNRITSAILNIADKLPTLILDNMLRQYCISIQLEGYMHPPRVSLRILDLQKYPRLIASAQRQMYNKLLVP